MSSTPASTPSFSSTGSTPVTASSTATPNGPPSTNSHRTTTTTTTPSSSSSGAEGGGGEQYGAKSSSSSGGGSGSNNNQASSQHFILSPFVVRNLQEKTKEKRKLGGEEIEQLVRKLHYGGAERDREGVVRVLKQLQYQFCESQSSVHARKGGLWGIASACIALQNETKLYLGLVMPTVIKCFRDTDSKVRFHACEALYNIAKVVRGRGGILRYFCPGIFDALCSIAADPDNAVRNAGMILDRLMKDIVTEDNDIGASGPDLWNPNATAVAISSGGASGASDGGSNEQVEETHDSQDYFDMDMFIKMVRTRIHTSNPYIRQFLVGWLIVLDSVPDLNLIEYLPEFLGGLVRMLGDGQREIVQQAKILLDEFLIEVEQTATLLPHHRLVLILIACLWETTNVNGRETKSILHSSVLIITTVLEWLDFFLKNLAKDDMLKYSSDILNAVLVNIGHKQESIRIVANATNKSLEHFITKSNVDALRQEMHRVVSVVAFRGLSSTYKNDMACRICSLKWLMILIGKDSEGMMNYGVDKLFDLLLKCLSDPSEHVVSLALQVLALISATEQRHFTRFLTLLLRKFRQDNQLIEKVGFIIRQLSVMLNPEKIYREIAQLLEDSSTLFHDVNRRDVNDATASRDFQFASNLVQILNMTLLTSKELREVRNVIRDNGGGKSLLSALYKSWSFNPVSTLELCLLAKAYKHASLLVQCLSETELTVHFLVQVDNLVQLIESPIFLDLRMALLEPHKNPYLLKSLYGILMLLPVQSSAHDKLNKRLQCVQTLSLLSFIDNKNGGQEEKEEEGMEGLLDHFKMIQDSQTLSKNGGMDL